MEKGQILNHRYEIIMQLVSNIKHNIYLCQHIKLNTLWIIKKTSKDNIKIMQTEINILKRLNHSCIPRVIDYFEIENDIFFVQDYFEGNTLEEIIQDKGKINEEKASEWIRKIANILDYLHGIEPYPISYNDLKPSNIIVTSDECIKLIDFEAARDNEYGNSLCMGTIGYAAPELYQGYIDKTSDIYSLGSVMCYMLTGDKCNLPIFNINNKQSLSEKMSFIIQKCTQQNISMRYQNIQELLCDL